MSDPRDGSDVPAHPEPEPALRGYPPPVLPTGGTSAPLQGGPPGPPPGAVPYLPPGLPAGMPYAADGVPVPAAHPAGALPLPPNPGLPPYGTGAASPPGALTTAPYPPVPYGPPPRLPALPLQPARYPSLLRGPRYRWWKPLLAFLLAGALFLLTSVVALVPPLVVGLVRGVPDLGSYIVRTVTDTTNLGPVGFVATNLSLIVLIPIAMLATWIVHGVRPRFVSSVVGRIRWRWLLRCVAVLAPLWLVYVGFTVAVDPPAAGRPAHWVALLVIVLLMTPLQAAGEEYFFRGFLLQNVGAWFARPVLGLVVATTVSAVAFSAAHGSRDPWIFGSIACLAVAACLTAWRTGGLEAGIVMHATNNILTFFVTILIGGWQDAFIGADSEGTPAMLVLSVLVHGAAVALVFWQARRARIAPLSRPETAPAWAPAPAPVSPALPPTPGS